MSGLMALAAGAFSPAGLLFLGIILVAWLALLAALGVRAHLLARSRVSRIVMFAPELTAPEAERLIRAMGGQVSRHLPMIHGAVCHVPPTAATALSANDRITRVEEDIKVKAYSLFPFRLGFPPPPPQPPEQVPWGVSRIGAPAVWPSTTGVRVDVAVLDTGVTLDHPDLAGNLAPGANMVATLRKPNDDHGHGTHVAGTVAAMLNGLGVVGVAPEVRLHPVKVLDRTGGGNLSDIIAGLEWCVNQHIRVVNLSLGASQGSAAFAAAVTEAVAAGTVIVAAAGNDGPEPGTVGYPARYPEVIAVGAATQTDGVADFSSRGPEVDVVAPGDEIQSDWVGQSYQTLSGTSMASPHVAGLVALLLSVNPDLTPAQVKTILQQSADSLAGWPSEAQGAGLVNAPRAMASVPRAQQSV